MSWHASGKLVRAGAHAIVGFFTIKLHFPKLSLSERDARVNAWAARMLQIVGIALEVRGTPPLAGPVLLVSNHISWLDIVVLHAARHCRFIAKSDVQRWPFIGTLADGAGTLYIQRESRRDAHRMVNLMAERLRAGDVLAVFPEGTTGDGRQLKPFHANLIQAAIVAGVPVQPIALQFIHARTGELSFAPSYVDGETLLGSIWRTLRAQELKTVVHFGTLHYPLPGQHRRVWAQSLRQEIEELRLTKPSTPQHRQF